MTDDIDVAVMNQRRDEFCTWMEMVKAKRRVMNSMQTVRCTTGDRIEMTNFFFDQLMGAGGIFSLSTLLKYYTSRPEGVPDHGLGARPMRLAKDVSQLPVLCLFYEHLGLQQITTHPNSTLFHKLLANAWSIDLLHQSNALQYMVKERDVTLGQCLRSVGEESGVDKDWMTCLKNYLAKSLYLTTQSFTIVIGSGRYIYTFVQSFGNGILCLLPKYIIRK